MPASKASKKTSFVPRAVFRVAVTGAGVIPLCVTASLTSQGCGNVGFSVAEMCFADGAPCPSVALACFGDGPNKCHGVADATFRDVKVDREGGVLPDMLLGVADGTFKDVKSDGDGGVMDVVFGVADVAFKG
jgi:hypothetical protein